MQATDAEAQFTGRLGANHAVAGLFDAAGNLIH